MNVEEGTKAPKRVRVRAGGLRSDVLDAMPMGTLHDDYDVEWDAHKKALATVPEECRKADLSQYSLTTLRNRKSRFEAEALFENDPQARAALYREAFRTQRELLRREALETAAA